VRDFRKGQKPPNKKKARLTGKKMVDSPLKSNVQAPLKTMRKGGEKKKGLFRWRYKKRVRKKSKKD